MYVGIQADNRKKYVPHQRGEETNCLSHPHNKMNPRSEKTPKTTHSITDIEGLKLNKQ